MLSLTAPEVPSTALPQGLQEGRQHFSLAVMTVAPLAEYASLLTAIEHGYICLSNYA